MFTLYSTQKKSLFALGLLLASIGGTQVYQTIKKAQMKQALTPVINILEIQSMAYQQNKCEAHPNNAACQQLKHDMRTTYDELLLMFEGE